MTQPTFSDHQVSKVLNDAADIIAANGLCKGAFGWSRRDGKRCALGAISDAAEFAAEFAYLVERLAVNVLREVIGDEVGKWNDAKSRTAAEVVAALREAAQLARQAK